MPKRKLKKVKNPIRPLQKELDKELSRLITSVGYCAHCRSISTLQCSHIIPRTNHALRYNPINLLPLCFRCHIEWWHKNPIEAYEWFEKAYPNRKIYLDENKNKIIKRTAEDYRALIEAVRARNMKFLVDN